MPAQLRNRRIVLLLVGTAALSVVPFALEDFWVFQLTLVMASSIALLGVNLLTGFNGQISLGHGAFFALGAYAQAILMTHFSVPYALALPVAGVLCLGFGMLFGLPALRLEGLYLALATFALGVALPQLLKYRHFEAWTGGVQGITLTKPSAPFGLALSQDQWLYFFVMSLALVCFLTARSLLKSHVGRAIIAIRDQPIAAAAMGIDVARYKTITFGISALYTGVAGALTAVAVQFVAPDSFTSLLSIDLLVGIVVGGIAQLPGAIYGALFLRFVPTLTEHLSKSATGAIYGVILIVFVYAMPYGIAGFVTRMFMRLEQAMKRRGS
jgi:branched-chain amino acid transport system permease protein